MNNPSYNRILMKWVFFSCLILSIFFSGESVKPQEGDPPLNEPPVVERIYLRSTFNAFTKQILTYFTVSDDYGINRIEYTIVAHSDSFIDNRILLTPRFSRQVIFLLSKMLLFR